MNALEQLRAAATDCARAADDYDAEGLHGIADRFREHAANLWLIAGDERGALLAAAQPGEANT
jgi:hypothetical protein